MPEPPSSFSRDRRRLLIVGGFGALSYAVLREIPDRASQTATASGTPTTTIQVREPVGPPAIDEASATTLPPDHVFDLVIENGRVMDPDTGFDRKAHVGVNGDTITAIEIDTDKQLEGNRRIDARGMVVAPGFIDVLSYEPNDYGIWYKVADGVTTNLGMHGINAEAANFFPTYEGRVPCHFGGAFDNPWMRSEIVGLTGATDEALPSQIDQLEELLRAGFDAGWIGLDFEPEYIPGTSVAEMTQLSLVAAERNAPVFFHARYSDAENNLTGIDEVLQVARDTGAAVHVAHITSTGGTFTMTETLAHLEDARAEGIDVTACLYPYDFWATTLGSARFGPDEAGVPAVERFRIDYEDLVIVGTDTHLTEATFNSMRANGENPLVAALDSIPDAEIDAALKTDWIMLGSDAILEPGDNNHPRSTGCFARLLGEYVRERKVLNLQSALAKMTILPAKRLEGAAPVMKKKGRLQRGAHADITIFDPTTIIDKGTVESPGVESEGVNYVLVMGQVVRDPDGNQTDVLPGQPIGPV